MTKPESLVVILCLVSALLIFFRIGEASLANWDEAIYAQVARETVTENSWLTLQYNGQDWFHKPPLYMWMTSVSQLILGETETAARSASALAGVFLAVVTFFWVRKMRNEKVALLAVVVLLTTRHIIFASRFGTTDVLLTLCIYGALLFYLYTASNPKYWYLVSTFAGLAIMTKGAAGLVLPIILFIFLIYDKRLVETIRERHFWIALIPAAILVIPWHVYQYVKSGQDFLREYVGYHVIDRSQSALEGNDGGIFFYIHVVRRYFSPWVFLFAASGIYAARELRNKKTNIHYPIIAIATVGLLYTVIQTKLMWYILPIYPALAFIVADMVYRAYKKTRSLAYILVIAAPALVLIFDYTFASFVALLIVYGVATIVYSMRKDVAIHRYLVIAVAVFFFMGAAGEISTLYSNKVSPAATISRDATCDPSEPEPLMVITDLKDLAKPVAFYYSNCEVHQVKSADKLANVSRKNDAVKILAAQDQLPALKALQPLEILSENDEYIYAEFLETIKPAAKKNEPDVK
ncbi:ArnT family glycosyltransferase [Patescibacteria group bacterium]